jgi:hypothetical protein
MLKSVAAVVSLGVASFGVSQADIDMFRDTSYEVAAHASIRGVFQSASADSALGGVPFDEALLNAVSSAVDETGSLSANGQTLTWRFDDVCFDATFPDELTWVAPSECSAP